MADVGGILPTSATQAGDELPRSWFSFVRLLALALTLASCAPSEASDPGGGPGARTATSLSGDATAVTGASSPTANSPAEVIEHGSRDHPLVALTFDADMTPSMLERLRAGTVQRWYDPTIIAELRSTKTPATIFATGLWASEYGDALREISADPLFEIANHSATHAAFHGPCHGLDVITSPDIKLHEVVDAAKTLEELTGQRPRFFRFPGGCYGPSDVSLVQGTGEQPVGWDVVSGDPFQADPSVIVRNVLDNVRPGSIVVLHLNGAPNAPATAAALRQIIPGLRTRGLRPVTLEELLSS